MPQKVFTFACENLKWKVHKGILSNKIYLVVFPILKSISLTSTCRHFRALTRTNLALHVGYTMNLRGLERHPARTQATAFSITRHLAIGLGLSDLGSQTWIFLQPGEKSTLLSLLVGVAGHGLSARGCEPFAGDT